MQQIKQAFTTFMWGDEKRVEIGEGINAAVIPSFNLHI